MKFIIVAFALVAFVAAQEDKDAQVLSQTLDIAPDGTYQASYETSNGIRASESGASGVAAGEFEYRDSNGVPIAVSYVADANGFQPQGAHLPVAPEIPEGIQRSLEYIRTHSTTERSDS